MNLNKSEEITIKDIFKLYNEFKALLKQHVFKILTKNKKIYNIE